MSLKFIVKPVFILLLSHAFFAHSADLQVTPLEQKLIIAITENSAMAMNTFSELSGTDFNYSEQSVVWLGNFINRNRSSEPGQLVDVIGSYLGEAIIHKYNGKWVSFNGEPAVELKKDLVVFPFGKVEKHFVNGSEDSIAALFKAMPSIIKEFEAKDTSNK